MIRKMLGSLVLMCVCCCVNMSVSYADRIDNYRQILQNGKFCLRYKEVTPQDRTTNKDKVYIMGRNSMPTGSAEFMVHQSTEGIVTQDGMSKYEEVASQYAAMCRLTKNEEVFNFTKLIDPKKKTTVYYGNGKGKVEAGEINYLAMLEQGPSYGTDALTLAINAMIPNRLKGSCSLKFSKVDSGNLSGGLYHEDYRADYPAGMSVVRYYFSGNNLVKIALAQYGTNGKGKFDGTRHVFTITEFSNVPMKELLNLPKGLVDKTKRNKSAAKEGTK